MSRRHKKPRRTWPQRVLIITNVVLCIGALTAAGTLNYARNWVRQLNVVEVEGSTRANASTVSIDEPRNFLIIGTDWAGRLDPSDPVTNEREHLNLLSDVMMILRVDPKSERAHLLSIPRDTTMPIYPNGHVRRINSAIQGEGGAKNLIETIKRNLGISIDHFVQIDLYAFKTIVGTLGGVNAYFTTPIWDDNTHIDIKSAGCVKLDKDQALAYARARHLKFRNEDGDWEYEHTGDPGRVERQQQFVKLIMREAISRGIRNPSTALSVGNNVADVVTTDEQLSVRSLIDLGRQFRTFSADDLVTQIVPTEDYKGPQDAAYQRILWDEAGPILDFYRGVTPGQPIQPRQVIVDVVGTADRSPRSVARSLVAFGFDASGFADEESDRSRTIIRYGVDGGESALLVASYLDADVDFRFDEDIHGRQIHVVLGSDFNNVRSAAADLSAIEPEELRQLMDATGLEIGPDGVASTTTVTADESSTADRTDTSNTDGNESASDTSLTGISTSVTGDVSTTLDGTNPSTSDVGTTSSGSTEPTTATTAPVDKSSEVVGGFLPIDYEKSLSCSG